jgi:O-antigen/teichoic acid export membrane protein
MKTDGKPLAQSLDLMDRPELQRLQILIYLLPIVGTLPSLWTLYQRSESTQAAQVSRVSIRLLLLWLGSYTLLNAGAQAAEVMAVPLLVANSLLTSGYFVLSLWLMRQLWRRRRVDLPVIGRIH